MGKNQKPPKKKEYFVKTTSKRTGAIILISTIALLAFMVAFYFYATDFANKQREYENNWRLMSCPDMKKDYDADPYVWKVVTMKDMLCITDSEFQIIMKGLEK